VIALAQRGPSLCAGSTATLSAARRRHNLATATRLPELPAVVLVEARLVAL
jgi:hypothetical protein